MTIEEHIELAYRAAYSQGHRDGSGGTAADGDEHLQRYKKIHFDVDSIGWSFADHLNRIP